MGEKYPIHLDDFRCEPGEKECLAVIWSHGRACKKCDHTECYRVGWPKSAVDTDNHKLVLEKRNANRP